MEYQITRAPSFLYDIGVTYFDYGTISKGKNKLFDYYKCDAITATQRATILEWCKDAYFPRSFCEFAPELTSQLVAFPKAGFYRGKSA